MTASFLYLDLDIVTRSDYLQYLNTYPVLHTEILKLHTNTMIPIAPTAVGHECLCPSTAIFF